jgi:hypothetical protein
MNHNINREFEDKSWDAMRALLDREMPEGGVLIPPAATNAAISKDSKKRYGLWALFFAATCLVASLAWYALNKNVLTEKKAVSIVENRDDSVLHDIKNGQNTEGDNAEIPTSNLNENKVSDKREESMNNKPMRFLKPHRFDLVKKGQNTEGGITEISTSHFSENKVSNKREESTGNKPMRFLKPHRFDLVKKGQNTEGGITFAIPRNEKSEPKIPSFAHPDSSLLEIPKESTWGITTGANINSFNTESQEPLKEKMNRLTDLPYDFLPLAKAEVVEYKDPNFKINLVENKKNILAVTKSKPLHWGITAGAHTEGGKKLDGFQAGLFLTKIMSEKWTIQTGLNYRRNTAQGDSMTFVQLDKAATGITTNPSTALPSFNLVQGTEITLKNLNYLELPVTVQYAFHRKFSTFSGLKIAYLLSNSVNSDNSTKFYVLDNSKNDQRTKGFGNQIVQGNSAQSLGLQRWDLALVGGVSYRVLPKISMSLRYDYGFKNILNHQNWKAYNRYLGVYISYSF